jgi:hypothetical protein
MQPNQPNRDRKASPLENRQAAWMEILETVVLILASFFDPTPTSTLLLKLCFQVLKLLRRPPID